MSVIIHLTMYSLSDYLTNDDISILIELFMVSIVLETIEMILSIYINNFV